MTKYTLAETIVMAKKAVEDRGADWVYPNMYEHPDWYIWDDDPVCRYVGPHGEPGCIVGHVLYQIGLLDKAEEKTPAFTLSVLQKNFEPDAVEFLNTFQQYQDAGDSWGNAMAAAVDQAKFPTG